MGTDLVAGAKSKETKRNALSQAPRKAIAVSGSEDRKQFECGDIEAVIYEQDQQASHFMQGNEDKIAVLVGTVTDDTRVYEVPATKVAALKFTERVRARIEKSGGECITFDQLALRAPLGQNTV